MRIEQPHQLGKAEARKRVEALVEELLREKLPAGVVLSELVKEWNADTMQFSFTAKKGFFGAKITGSLAVTDNQLNLEIELPSILKSFVPEDKIRDAIQQKLASVCRD